MLRKIKMSYLSASLVYLGIFLLNVHASGAGAEITFWSIGISRFPEFALKHSVNRAQPGRRKHDKRRKWRRADGGKKNMLNPERRVRMVWRQRADEKKMFEKNNAKSLGRSREYRTRNNVENRARRADVKKKKMFWKKKKENAKYLLWGDLTKTRDFRTQISDKDGAEVRRRRTRRRTERSNEDEMCGRRERNSEGVRRKYGPFAVRPAVYIGEQRSARRRVSTESVRFEGREVRGPQLLVPGRLEGGAGFSAIGRRSLVVGETHAHRIVQ